MQVTVDLEDLERIVYAASAVKQIEGALAAWKRDPFVQPHLEFTPAQKRLESAMRNAKRAAADTVVKYDEPLTEEEASMLSEVVDSFVAVEITASEKAPKPGELMSIYDRLAAKGAVEIGQKLNGVLWAGADRPEIVPVPKYLVRETARGCGMLAQKRASA